jgi:hypothetical protein
VGDGRGDLLVIANNALATYAFDSSIGPLNDPAPFGSGFAHIDSSGDTLSVFDWSNGSFTATFEATSTPEPTTLALLGAGVGGLITLRRRRTANR